MFVLLTWIQSKHLLPPGYGVIPKHDSWRKGLNNDNSLVPLLLPLFPLLLSPELLKYWPSWVLSQPGANPEEASLSIFVCLPLPPTGWLSPWGRKNTADLPPSGLIIGRASKELDFLPYCPQGLSGPSDWPEPQTVGGWELSWSLWLHHRGPLGCSEEPSLRSCEAPPHGLSLTHLKWMSKA